MSGQNYQLVLEEKTNNFYEVSSPELPDFRADVAGSMAFEALDRARRELSRWVARQKELRRPLPPGRGRGYILFAEGAEKTGSQLLWSKADLRRFTGLSRATIDRRVREGLFVPKRVGRRVLFDPAQVRAAIENKPSAPAEKWTRSIRF